MKLVQIGCLLPSTSFCSGELRVHITPHWPPRNQGGLRPVCHLHVYGESSGAVLRHPCSPEPSPPRASRRAPCTHLREEGGTGVKGLSSQEAEGVSRPGLASTVPGGHACAHSSPCPSVILHPQHCRPAPGSSPVSARRLLRPDLSGGSLGDPHPD